MTWPPPTGPQPSGPLPHPPLPPAGGIKPKPVRRRRSRAGPIAVGGVAALVAGVAGGAVGARLRDNEPPSTVVRREPIEIPGDRLDVAAIVDVMGPSVVTITASNSDDPSSSSVGTGVILSTEGEIVTNAHVVAGFGRIAVLIAGEREPRAGAVVAVDPNNDLAVVRIDDTSNLVPAEFAAPDDVQVGDDVVAIGYALHLDGAPSVTRGIISALDRSVELEGGVLDGLLQTDAAISSGNSGGPLVNARGQVVGINTASARSGPVIAANNVGFAISVAEAGPVIAQLRDGQGADGAPIAAGFLGVDLGNRRDGGTGAVILGVSAGTPAAAAGLQIDDLVVAVDSTTIASAAGLAAAIRDSRPGAELSLQVVRNGEELTVPVVLAERTPD